MSLDKMARAGVAAITKLARSPDAAARRAAIPRGDALEDGN